jgi:hypothetical protein
MTCSEVRGVREGAAQEWLGKTIMQNKCQYYGKVELFQESGSNFSELPLQGLGLVSS